MYPPRFSKEMEKGSQKMTAIDKKGLYFTGVAAAGRDRAIVTGHYWAHEETDERITAARLIDGGKWTSLRGYTGIVHATRHDAGAKLEFLLMERALTLYRVSAAAEFKYETISESREGFLMDLRKIGAGWYAVGGQHQAFRMGGKGWRAIDKTLFLPNEEDHSALLQSVHGLDESDIYAVGTSGVVFHFDGEEWEEVESPTDYDLERVLVVKQDEVYLSGCGGVLFRGGRDSWLALTEPDEKLTFWDMALFEGKVFVCSDDKLFTVDGNELQEVEIPLRGPFRFYRMDAGEGDLWTVGDECILQFDGKTWTRHTCPENE